MEMDYNLKNQSKLFKLFLCFFKNNRLPNSQCELKGWIHGLPHVHELK